MKEKTITLEINNQEYEVVIHEFTAEEATVSVNTKKYRVLLKNLGLEQVPDIKPKVMPSVTPPVTAPAPSTSLHRPKAIAEANAIVAPLPGLIQQIHVKVGEPVKTGQHLLTMEAMKMENEIQAVRDGVVSAIKVKVGDSVSEGDTLIIID
jgi:biotin carboxyl carrier protein